jgi:AcrR family transcriptional regulator
LSKVIEMARQAPAPPKTRKDQKEDTKERIRAAALELFSTVGYEATTTKAVADRAGVASGTVFVHARDKPDLLALVMNDLLRSAVERGFAAVDPRDPLLEQLLTVFRRIFAMYGDNPKLGGPFIRTLPG